MRKGQGTTMWIVVFGVLALIVMGIMDYGVGNGQHASVIYCAGSRAIPREVIEVSWSCESAKLFCIKVSLELGKYLCANPSDIYPGA